MKAKQVFSIAAFALAASAAFAQQAAPLTRAEVKEQVFAARANGTLRHAGEAGPEEMTPYRAQVEEPRHAGQPGRYERRHSALDVRNDGTHARPSSTRLLGIGSKARFK